MTGGAAQLLATGAGLGVLGMDPAGALLAAAAIAAGARRRDVAVFGLVVLVGTVALGTVLSETVGARLGVLDWSTILPRGGWRAAVEAAAALVLGGWVIARTRRGPRPPREDGVRAGLGGAAISGGLFIGTALTDPTFVALVVLAGRAGDPVATVLASTAWTVVSQLPLVLVVVALAGRRHRAMMAGLRRWRLRWAARLRALVTASLAVVAAVPAIDVLWWLLGGAFLVGR